MRTRFTLAAGLVIGFLLGSKAGPKPYEVFHAGMQRLRNSRVVAAPIEAAAQSVSNKVREHGEMITDRAAFTVYEKIAGVGQDPLVVEATVTTVERD